MSDHPGDQWAADPTGRHQLRYFAAGEWTDNVSDNGTTSIDPVSPARAPVAPAPVAPMAPIAPQAPLSPGAPPAPGSATGPLLGAAPGGAPPAASSGVSPAGSPNYQPGAPYASAPAPGYGTPPPAAPKRRPVIGFALTMIGAVVTIVGGVLPWITISGVSSSSIAGTEGDGVLTIVLAVITAIFGVILLLTRARALGIVIIIGALLVGAIGVYHTSNLGDLPTIPGVVEASVGVGVWVTIVGGVLLLLGGIAGFARR